MGAKTPTSDIKSSLTDGFFGTKQMNSKPKEKTKRKVRDHAGRPSIIFTEKDWEKINKYLMAQCNGREIAGIMGISSDKFYDLIVEKYHHQYNINNFSEYQSIKRREGLDLLRASQFSSAMSGNTTMQIWLGKQLLGQRDQIDNNIIAPSVHIQSISAEEQAKIQTAMIAIEAHTHEGHGNIHEEPDGDSGQ